MEPGPGHASRKMSEDCTWSSCSPLGLLRGHLCHERRGEMVGPLRATGSHAPLQRAQLRELRAEGGDSIPGAAAETRHKSCAYVEHTQVLAAANAVLHNANNSG